MENRNLKVSPAPYIKKGLEINKIMIDFIIALIPAIFAGIYFYKVDAAKILITTILTSIIAEGLWNKYVKKTSFLTDLSPVVLGIILGLIMPTYVPLWIPIIGSIFATIVVKQFFGGYGQNFMNPAAATKAFLIASWAGVMAKPVADATSAASGATEVTVSLVDKIIGQASGSIGEVSILALCLGGLYLAFRGRISLRGPITFILSAMVMYNIFDKELLLPGAFFVAAIFMTTDYGTTPMTRIGQYIFGIIAGICASIIAVKGFNPEGPYYAIIIMNLCTPLIEYLTTKKIKVKKEA
ncbi:MAG: RnfABCDGE type electron transport complex subunit D [Clostridium sp.]|uniref:RnfABCDGE type electron transport complex subunit D n=1 Tax=Clostridium sp. TaxID=1506 RepID=UPI0025E0F814|nr:RnfABCDGE type electron transport complex subunit D [Clostridium sp.]MCI6691056.1 RnfABCDGE type electron transport complex subunit D [Clostridium sp.]MDY2632173.1 RnfABCDGE type electron transport complex subunit D [Clostridium sp.]